VDAERVGRTEPPLSGPALGFAVAVAVCLGSLVGAAVAGGPYLALDSLNPWLAVFAVALFGGLFAVPFAANRVLLARRPEQDEAWEGSMVAWGAVASLALGAGVLLILVGAFDPADSLADAVGLLLAIEAGLVAVTLVIWVLSG
jgi:hypothetical protein